MTESDVASSELRGGTVPSRTCKFGLISEEKYFGVDSLQRATSDHLKFLGLRMDA